MKHENVTVGHLLKVIAERLHAGAIGLDTVVMIDSDQVTDEYTYWTVNTVSVRRVAILTDPGPDPGDPYGDPEPRPRLVVSIL